MKRAVGVVFLFVVAFVLPSFGAGSATRDLGEGLIYLRAVAESGSGNSEFVLPVVGSTDEAEQASLVLDLRYADGGAREAGRLSEWLSERADASFEAAPIFFLVNAETSTALREVAVQFAQSYPALLIGGAASEDVADIFPDIVLSIDAEEERTAYSLLASSEVDIGALIGEGGAATDKRRYDEAAMIAAHAAPASDREPGTGSGRSGRRSHEAVASENTEVTGETPLVRPIDLALQRAIHLHRAWRVFEPHLQP